MCKQRFTVLRVIASLLVTMLAIASLPVQGDVYRSVDAQGRVTYSDQPVPGAKKIKLPGVTTYSPRPVRETETKPKQTRLRRYQSVEILKPKPDETIWDNQGIVELLVALEPALSVSEGHRFLVTIDGKPHGKPRTNVRMHFADLDRGTHEIAVRVIDQKGEKIISSRSVTFHLHRQSALFRNGASNKFPALPALPGSNPP